MARRIYLASSWRNAAQPALVATLRAAGHEVYDFRNPAEGQNGFAWSAIDREWLTWEPEQFAKLLRTHPVAQEGFGHDKRALDWCDTCVLLLPSGRSAHLEAGYAAGQGKQVVTLLAAEGFEPELMYLLGDAVVTSEDEMLLILAQPLAPRETVATAARAVVAIWNSDDAWADDIVAALDEPMERLRGALPAAA